MADVGRIFTLLFIFYFNRDWPGHVALVCREYFDMLPFNEAKVDTYLNTMVFLKLSRDKMCSRKKK